MNVSILSQKDYENKSNWTLGENKPNQSQFPKSQNECKLTYNKELQKKRRFRSPKKQTQFKANLLDAQMNATSFITKEYENERLSRHGENEPNQTQFQTGHLLVNRMKPKLLNFHLKNSLTVWLNSVKYRFLCSERECFYEELYGKEKSGRA